LYAKGSEQDVQVQIDEQKSIVKSEQISEDSIQKDDEKEIFAEQTPIKGPETTNQVENC
jgi:hypothetical protein